MKRQNSACILRWKQLSINLAQALLCERSGCTSMKPAGSVVHCQLSFHCCCLLGLGNIQGEVQGGELGRPCHLEDSFALCSQQKL